MGNGLNKYAYTSNNPVNLVDPSGNMDALPTDGGAGGYIPGSSYTEDEELDWDRYRDIFSSVNNPARTDFLKNDPLTSPEYSTWRALVQGSPCTGCHVTHTFTQNGIPDNSQIDANLVDYYRSLDKVAYDLHMAALSGAASYSSLGYQMTDVWEAERANWIASYQAVRVDLRSKGLNVILVGDREMDQWHNLSKANGTYKPAIGIIMKTDGDFLKMTGTLHHEYLHHLDLYSNPPPSINGLGGASALVDRYAESELWVYGQMMNQPYISQGIAESNKAGFLLFARNIGKLSPIEMWMKYVGPF